MNTYLYTLQKLPLDLIIRQDFNVALDETEALKYRITESPSLLLDQIELLRGHKKMHMNEIIFVEAKRNPKKEDQLRRLLIEGFDYQHQHYLRFGKSASQAKAGITAFVDARIYDRLYQATMLDIPIKECVISKYEAQRCLVFSSCILIPDYMPKIVIIDEYQKVLKDQWIKYVVEKEKN